MVAQLGEDVVPRVGGDVLCTQTQLVDKASSRLGCRLIGREMGKSSEQDRDRRGVNLVFLLELPPLRLEMSHPAVQIFPLHLFGAPVHQGIGIRPNLLRDPGPTEPGELGKFPEGFPVFCRNPVAACTLCLSQLGQKPVIKDGP